MQDFSIEIPTINPILGAVKQIAYIVGDIDQAIDYWNETYGIGPWLVTRDAKPLNKAYYRGDIAEAVVLDIAFAYHGGLQIELIALKNDVPSMYKEVIERDQKDLQHYGVCVPDFEAAIEYYQANGFTPIIEAGIKGIAQMHYVEATDFDKNIFEEGEQGFMKSPEGHGIVLEVIEDNAVTKPYFDTIEKMVAEIPEGQKIKEFSLSSITPTGAVIATMGKFLLKKITGKL